jgi:hypothetical protein
MSHKGNKPPDASAGPSASEVGEVLLRPGIDRVFESLKRRRRRLVLLALKRGSVETEADVMVRGGDETGAAEIDLYHSHLPKLAEAGYIEWDPDTGEISEGPRFDEVEPLLELIERHADELPPGWP